MSMRSHLSIPHRVALLRDGLLSESSVRDLIQDAVDLNLTHYLPAEIREYGAVLLHRKTITRSES